MGIFKCFAFVLVISVVQISCFSTSRTTRNANLKASTRENSKDEYEYESIIGIFFDKLKMNDGQYIANVFEKLGIDDFQDHITNLKLFLEDDDEREAEELLKLKDQDYGNDKIHCKTEPTSKSHVILKGYKKTCAIDMGMQIRTIILEEKTLTLVMDKLRQRLPKSPKIWRLKERLDEIYRRILHLVRGEKRYNYNLMVFYTTLYLTIKENVSFLNRITLEESLRKVEKLLRLPVIRYYLQHLTGISDLKEGYISNVYKEVKKELKEDNESNRKLRKEYKASITNFIKIIIVDIEENYFPVATIDFVLDNIEGLIPMIETINYQSRLRMKRSAEVSYTQKPFGKMPKPGEKEFDEGVKRAQEELKQFLIEITEMGIEEIGKFFDELEWKK